MTAGVIPLYSHPRLYEVSYDGVMADELPFLRAILERYYRRGARVLELAAGSGRVTVPLAQMGYRMTALDLEPAMLERLRHHSRDHLVEIDTLVSDMRDFRLAQPVDAVLCLLGVACCAHEPGDFERMLGCIGKALEPGGIVVLVLVAAEEPGDVVPHYSTWHAVRGEIRTQSWFSYTRIEGGSDPAVVAYEFRISASEGLREPVLLEDAGRLRIISTRFLINSCKAAGLGFLSWFPMFDSGRPGQVIPDQSGAAVALLQKP